MKQFIDYLGLKRPDASRGFVPLPFRDIIHTLQEHTMEKFVFEDLTTGRKTEIEDQSLTQAMLTYLAYEGVAVWTAEDWAKIRAEMDENS